MIAEVLLALTLVQQPGTPAERIQPRVLPVPGRTTWRPQGCRDVPFTHPVLPPRTAFRRAHGDLESSDEVELAYPPQLARQWVAEPQLYQVTTPAFDSAGNLYMTPLLPHEPILMLSLDPTTGARRFALPLGDGQRGGGAVPLVLRDPDSGGEVVYVNSYQRVTAVRTDGSLVWDVPTGLGDALAAAQSPIGLAWVPNADAIVALTRDGHVVLLDRRSGAALLPAPFLMPGEATPLVPSTTPQALIDTVSAMLAPLVRFSDGAGVRDLIQVLLGGNSKVANNLSVDGRRNRLWIAASAPDADDGVIDGVSALGALYRLDVVQEAGAWTLRHGCSRTFSGGSASTPTLGRDGTRVYLGDDAGALLALDAETCATVWEMPLDDQIFGSIAAASDGRELYAASAGGIFQVFDDGASGRRGWTAALDLYAIPPDLSTYTGLNLLLTGIGANGLLLQAGVGVRTAQSLPARTAVVHVDRQTGLPRAMADGLEESLGAMSTGPDGALYLPHAPLRRAFALALGFTAEPLIGGVSKWAATRHDLLARDAACAAGDRAANAAAQRGLCPAGSEADAAQVGALRQQLLDSAALAEAEGDLDAALGRRLRWLGARVGAPPVRSALATDERWQRRVTRYHRKASRGLGRACRLLTSATES